MNLREAAEMALEALETLWDILDDIDTTSDIAKENDAWYRKRVEFLQKKRWDTAITTDGYKLKGGPIQALRQALAQPEQEPFIYVREDNERPFGGYEHCSEADAGAFPVYTAPPKREWVELTDEDKDELVESLPDFYSVEDVIASVAAKLKEKNGG